MKTAILSSLFTVGLGASAWASVPLTIPAGDSVIIDDFADGDYNSNLGPWVFSKAETSSLDTSIVDESGVKALKLDYTVSSGFIMPKDYPYGMQMSEGYVEAKVFLDENQNAIDLSSCTEIRFDYKQPQNSMVMMITQSFAVIDGNGQAYSKSLNSAMYYNQSFQTARIKWSDLVGDEDAAEGVAKNVSAFSWKISSPSMMGMSAQGSLEIANVRCVNLPVYTVKFYKGDELLQSKKYLQGEVPYYDGGLPSSDQYWYNFRGWEPEITAVVADASYRAVLDSGLRSYDVYFYDADDNQLMYQSYEYGTTPNYVGVNPVKLPSVGYSYTFKGWGKETCGDVEYEYCHDEDDCYTDYDYRCWIEYVENLPPVTGDASYYPVYDSTVNVYTVKFANADGEILSSQDYAYGTKASDIVRPADPTRESKNGVKYTFEGWIPEVSNVSGHVVYVASYSAETADGDPAEIYTVTFVDESGVLEVKEYTSGEYAEYTGSAEPAKESSVMYDYTFSDWQDQNGWYLGEVDENKVYMALFDEQYRKYWIVFLNEDGTVIDSVRYEYGDMIDYDVMDGKIGDGYSLQKWVPQLSRVTGRAVYQAEYRYEARFVAEDFYESDWVRKGETPECRDCTPEKKPTAEYTYEFIGWDKLPAPVTDTVTYTAVFKAVPIPAAPVTNIAVGDALLIDDFEDGDEISKQGGEWFVYDDSDSEYHYSSEISKTVSVKADGSKTLEVAHKRRCSWKGGYDCDGWLGVGVTLSSGGTPVDLSQCNAIQYDYRGSEHIFKVESVLDVDYNSVRTYVDSSENWKTVTIYLNKLKYGTVDADVAFKQAKQFIWSDMMGEGIFELDNIKCLHKPTYVAKFYYGENLIDSVMVAEGDEPEYDGAFSLDSVAEEMSDDKFEYVVDWTPEIVPATKDVAYTATFTKQPRKFWISFSTAKDWSDTLVEYGKTPVYEGDLTREADESCKEYIFDRWVSYDDEKGEDVYGLFPATRDRSYSAEYKCKTPVMITITFMDDDGETVLLTKEYPYGSDVDYYSPEKAPTARSTYRFSGWNPYFQRYAYSNMTYTAQFDENTRYYRVTFVNAEGGGMYSDDYEYGTLYSDITPPYWQPNKYSQDANYEFTGWSPALTDEDSVTGDVVFVPQYSAQYKVRFVDYDGYPIDVDGESSKYYPEGTLLSEIVKPANPTRESYSDSLTYEFVGWLPEIKEGDSLTGPMTFIAAYKSSDETYTISFMYENEIMWQTEVAKNSIPKYEGSEINPSWMDDGQYSYSWDPEDGWDKEITKVTGPAVYVAKIKQTPKKYTITFKNDDGTVLKTKEYEFGETITDAPTEAEVTANKTGEFRYSDKWCVQNSYTDWVCKVDGGKECLEWEEVQTTDLNCYNGLQTVSENRTYVANIQYRVKFYDGDGNLLNENDNGKWSDIASWYRYGDVIQYCYENDPEECYDSYLPTKQSTAQYAYAWTGYRLGNTIDENAWTPALDTVKGAVEYTALFDSTVRNYEVAFEDENGTILKAAESYPYGTPAADIDVPSDPSKNPTATEVYTFAGWNLQNVTRDVTYRASYTVSPRMYKITFVDENEGGLGTTSYSYGTPVSEIALPQAPEKPGYKFAGWTPEVAPVTAEVTYRTLYVPNNQFVVTWRNDDGTLLKTEFYTEGQTPSYAEIPTKESSVQYDYTFDGWTPAIMAVSGDVEYKATYKGTLRKYTVTFVNEDGSPLGTAKEYEYGTPIENIVVPEVPEKPSNEYYTFTFAGWMPALGEVTGNVTYKALFGNMKRSFKVTFKDSTGEVWNERTYYYKEVVNVPKDGPNTQTPECIYDFNKWVRVTGESDTVKSDMEYVATHSGTCHTRSYSVMFQDTLRGGWDWSSYPYGTKAEDIDVPTVSDTTIGDCEYRFVKWSPDLADVTSSVGYTTVYEKVCSEQYEVTWLNDDGQELRKSNYNKGEVPTFGATNPVKASSAKYDYRFVGWTPDVVAVTANAQYRAKFDSTVRKFAIQFVNYDGETVRSSAMYEYGTKANLIVAPTIPDTSVGNCTLKFDKWDKEFVDVTGTATYIAQYKSVCGTNPPASSSSVVPPASSSSEPPASSSSVTPPVSSSSVVPPVSSSSAVPPASSSSEPPVSSSSVTPPVSSSSVVPPASSSSVVPPASSSSGGTTSVYAVQNELKFGFANNLLTVVQSSPAMVRVQVFDMKGQQVVAFYEQVAGSKGFSLAGLERGNYMVRITSKSQKRSARIIVK